MKKLLDRAIRQWLPVRGKQLLVECARRNFMECTLRTFRANGFEPDVIFDVGAYIGNWTRLARKIFPEARVLMIEPQPSKKQSLQQFADQHQNITFRSALVGAESKPTVPFFDMETGSSVYEENSGAARNVIQLPMQTLSDIAEEAGFLGTRNALLKMDVQGSEFDVLRGADRVLPGVTAVLAEVSLVERNVGAPQFMEVITFLKDRGFTVYDLAGFRRIRKVLDQVDLIFIREDSPLRMTWRKADKR